MVKVTYTGQSKTVRVHRPEFYEFKQGETANVSKAFYESFKDHPDFEFETVKQKFGKTKEVKENALETSSSR